MSSRPLAKPAEPISVQRVASREDSYIPGLDGPLEALAAVLVLVDGVPGEEPLPAGGREELGLVRSAES